MSENETDKHGGGTDGASAPLKPPDLDYPSEAAGKTPLESLSRRTEPDDPETPGTPLQRLFWFGLLWLCGVGAVLLLATAIRAAIG